MKNPADLFLELADWDKREDNWSQLTKGDTFFSALEQLIRQKAFPPQADLWVEGCREFITDLETERRWEIARILVWCAEEAIMRPEVYQTSLDLASFTALGDLPGFIKKREKCAWDCIRTFLAPPQRAGVQVPIAAFREGGDGRNDEGFLALLAFEALQPGADQILHHPRDAFETVFNPEFESSIEDAWIAAKAFAPAKSANSSIPNSTTESSFDGRWRLLDMNGKPLTERMDGRSASGAAAWGWYCALSGKTYDPRVIVLAQIDRSGVLSPVDGVKAKTETIAAGGRFDTIVVADGRKKTEKDHNQVLAEATLRRLGKLGSIRVINLCDKENSPAAS